MRIFLSVLVLIFSLQSLSKADDIRDFEIEGTSIGDTLTNHFNESEVISGIPTSKGYSSDKFILSNIFPSNHEIYESLQFHFKKNSNPLLSNLKK